MYQLNFTKDQEDLIWNERHAFDEGMERLAANRSGVIIGNALPIPLDAWRRIDTRAQSIARSRLAVFGRLAAANTTPVGIADLLSFYAQTTDSNEVLVSMDGRVETKGDQANVQMVGTPVPIITTGARFGWRQMEVIRKGGNIIDLATFANGQRRLAEWLENMVLNGVASINVAGSSISGLRNFAQRFTANHTFTLATATGANWVTAVNQGLAGLESRNQFGRVTIFVNQGDYRSADTRDYAANYPGTILQRIQAISQVEEVVPASSVPANEMIFVADIGSGEWGSVLSAMPITTRPKTRQDPEDDYVFTMMAAQALQLRADANGQSAVAHLVQ
ncbi:Encapsulating protein for peroxidase [uncultured Caudovirales phage]|uniref:Encapsulating protein for peroxidase n=1 Tax=uncultured Caudovirales phage TaxID=2100421 RepID=A0A6J5NX03_9CAUD|nr:Encapsulating protein for peroxidase [uncultured Caudovirales phage]